METETEKGRNPFALHINSVQPSLLPGTIPTTFESKWWPLNLTILTMALYSFIKDLCFFFTPR